VEVLVVNSGSSSLKFELFEMDSELSLMRGEVERIGQEGSNLWVEGPADGPASDATDRPVAAADHHQAFGVILRALDTANGGRGIRDLAAVGHRVVHGGSRFAGPALIDASALEGIRELALLAPLHAKANVAGIEAAQACFPDVPQVAVFDTTFHRTMPDYAREYALPRELARANGIRRYGFHGTSHEYVARRAAAFLGRPLAELDLVTLHLGNGASACAIRGGHSVDTSMGMTPLEGLVMGTRCGDVDPAVPMLLGEITGRSREDVHRLLNFESGLAGVAGASDMREVHRRVEQGDDDARLALEMFCYRAKKYVGAYYAVLGRLDALVFTAGVGEHDADVRARVASGLPALGIEIDPALNVADTAQDPLGERAISPPGSPVAVLVIPTDEEREIARAVLACVRPDTQARDARRDP
jgi:acetate kinase